MAFRGDSTSLNRRVFLATTSSLALAQLMARGDSTPTNLPDFVHPDARIVRQEIAKDANAYWDWEMALEGIRPLNEFAKEYFRERFDAGSDFGRGNELDEFDFCEAVGKVHQITEPFPESHAADCIRDWLQTTEATQRLIDRGIAKQRFCFPQSHTVALYSGIVAEIIQDLRSAWPQRRKDFTKQALEPVAAWPKSLSFISDFFERVDTSELPDEDIEAARRQLLKTNNPVGRYLLHNLDDCDPYRGSLLRGQLHAEVTPLLLACRLFLNMHGRLPARLTELVEAKLIDSVPIDPFSGRPIQYHAPRQLLGSVGPKEDIDLRDPKTDVATLESQQLVWRIPLLTI